MPQSAGQHDGADTDTPWRSTAQHGEATATIGAATLIAMRNRNIRVVIAILFHEAVERLHQLLHFLAPILVPNRIADARINMPAQNLQGHFIHRATRG